MKRSNGFKCPDDFPMPTPISAEEVARALWRANHTNQKSWSPATKFPRRGKAPTYLTRQEAAKYLRLAKNTLAHHPKSIPYHKICGCVLYIKEELDRLIRLRPKDENFANVSLSNRKNIHTYLSRQEAAKYLRVGADLLTHHPKEILFHKLCNRALYVKEELDEIIRHNRYGSES
ncbi:MAG: helix-turn-helix domain-containing protein [Puniceicoccales bacterium]|jgi:muconolactone delta-isomerase|nr:helix-turn-helix domain-containing protein [Puniceicoccales bacterium]